MAKNIFLTFVASLLLCACGSEDIIPNQTLGSTDGPNKYTFNISVEGLEDSQTRAIKKSWTAGDKIFMWFDDNADAANADLVITTADGSNWTTESLRDEVSLKESGVIKALYLSSNSWDGTLPTVVPMVLYTDGTKVTYTCENNVVTANIGNWLYATQFQVVVSGLDDVTTPENYSLTCDKFSSLSSINVTTEGISVGTSNQATIGTTNADGIAFYFASLTKGADEEQKYALTLRNEGKWMKNYYFNKTLANENTKCKGLKLNASKLTAGMVQYWSFDGNVNNSITGYHGTYVNASLTTDRHGNENAAYLFSGGQRINIPSAACSFHQSSFTANVWVCTTMKSGLGNLLRCHPGSGAGWLFRYNAGNVEIWEGSSNEYQFISSDQTYADGKWHMLTYVRDTENKKGVLYADGKYVGEYTMGSGPNNYNTDLVIGACSWQGGYIEGFIGKIDDVQLYDGALSAADVHNLYYLQEDHLFNGHSYVDLGLPSGTLWATCNVGADVPEAAGCYYAWGETEEQSSGRYWWDTYKFGHVYKSIIKYTTTTRYSSSADGITSLEIVDDAAHVNWGGAWLIPTKEQLDELVNAENTTCTWTTCNGVAGELITSKSNGNSIFLPAAGIKDYSTHYENKSACHYASRDLYLNKDDACYNLRFQSRESEARWGRCAGRSIRAVVNISQ